MPCYSVNLMSVELKAADRALLKTAVESLGFTFSSTGNGITISTQKGSIVVTGETATMPRGMTDTFNAIKREYSRQVVSEAARVYGWTETTTTDDEIILRRYT